MVQEGAQAPDFLLSADDGSKVQLSSFRGHKVVLYFYPKDDTPGCTTQACDLRDSHAGLLAQGIVVLGVSPDSPASHVKFREKYQLNFPLLSDEDHGAAEAYGVWKEKSMYGRRFWGIERSTFFIDEEGVVTEVWRKVKPEGHAERVAGFFSQEA
ncbi:MAG: thioredoxin-dependent thiol peroxidase [Gemmatimonadetes bacterium]|nr:thioredoxin-dependent thiol peroxidase [Gemmatimonadota bacterium]NNM07274.1 thioredoxin-dependent thiol peroxidase [Gemmatimonadota bacterium]